MAEGSGLLYLTRADVEAAGVTIAEIIAALEVAFREKREGRVEMPPKPGVHPGSADNFVHAMPAWIPALRSVGVKWVSGFPGNTGRGLPCISGLIILNDPDIGIPMAVLDCTWITVMRTGAASALSARYLARPDSRVLGVLGCASKAAPTRRPSRWSRRGSPSCAPSPMSWGCASRHPSGRSS